MICIAVVLADVRAVSRHDGEGAAFQDHLVAAPGWPRPFARGNFGVADPHLAVALDDAARQFLRPVAAPDRLQRHRDEAPRPCHAAQRGWFADAIDGMRNGADVHRTTTLPLNDVFA